MEPNLLIRTSKNLGGLISKNSPAIFSGLGAAGVITTAVLAVRATPKAEQLIAKENDRLGYSPTQKDKIRVAWRCYTPTIGVGTATICCIVCANCISNRRAAAIGSLYGITETALREYQRKVEETIGERKATVLRDSITDDHVKANPPNLKELIITGRGETLCYDDLTGRYFKSSIEDIRQIVNNLNKRLLTEMFVSLNEYFYEIGIAGTKLGDMIGWSVEKGLIDVSFGSHITDGGEPALVISMKVEPKYMRG